MNRCSYIFRLDGYPYDYAFKYTIEEEELDMLHSVGSKGRYHDMM